MRPTGSAAGQAPFVVVHPGELVPELLAAWVEGQGFRPTLCQDLDELGQFLAAFRPSGALLPVDDAVLAVWRAACPDGPAPWVWVDRPDAPSLAAAVRANPAGVLATPPAASLVVNAPAAPEDPAGLDDLWLAASRVTGHALDGKHGAWIRACLAVTEAEPVARRLLAPILVEHLRSIALQRAFADGHPDRAVSLVPMLAGIAAHRAIPAAAHGVRIAMGETRGEIEAAAGPFLRLVDHAVGAMVDSLAPGGLLIIGGDASGVRLSRRPAAGQEGDHLTADAPEALIVGAREAGVLLALDDGPWPMLTLQPGAPLLPGVPAAPPQVLLLEPDPFLRAWARSQPGGRGISTPPWGPGDPLPAEAKVPGAWVVVDDALAPALAASAPPGVWLHGVPLRAAFGQRGVRFPVFPGAAPQGPPHRTGGGAAESPAPHRTGGGAAEGPAPHHSPTSPTGGTHLRPPPGGGGSAPQASEDAPDGPPGASPKGPSRGPWAAVGAAALLMLGLALASGLPTMLGQTGTPRGASHVSPTQPAQARVASLPQRGGREAPPGRSFAPVAGPERGPAAGARPAARARPATKAMPATRATPATEPAAGSTRAAGSAPAAGSPPAAAAPPAAASPPAGRSGPAPASAAASPLPGLPAAAETVAPPPGVADGALSAAAPPEPPPPPTAGDPAAPPTMVPGPSAAPRPAIAAGESPPPGRGREITIDLKARIAIVREDGRELARLPIAVGAPGSVTPRGEFRVTGVVLDPPYMRHGRVVPPFRQDPGNPLGTRWIALDRLPYGLHGTNDPKGVGGAVTDGCVRFSNLDVEELARWVRRGTRVRISALLRDLSGWRLAPVGATSHWTS